jgi:hypothetical protein
MMDKGSVGKEGAEFDLEVERGKITEFARAVKATDAAYFRREAPSSPPTFLTSMFFWEELVEGANPWHLVKMSQERGMHAEQEYVFHGPPPVAGTKLRCRSKIESMYEKAGKRGGTMTFAVMVTEFHDESGRLVAEARMTGVETERPPEEKQ